MNVTFAHSEDMSPLSQDKSRQLLISRMKHPSVRKTIGLISPYSGGNLGDGAILDAMIQNIHLRCPEAMVYGITLDTQSTTALHHISAFSLAGTPLSFYYAGASDSNVETKSSRKEEVNFYQKIKTQIKSIPFLYSQLRNLRDVVTIVFKETIHIVKSYKVVRNLDLLLVSGGGQLDEEWGGPWGHPYSLFKWALLAKIGRKKLAFVSVGACSLETKLSKFFVKWALSLATYRSYRDAGSKQIVETIGVRKKGLIVPDVAFSLSPEVDSEKSIGCYHRSKPREAITVGISPIAYGDPRAWPKEDNIIYKNYISQLTSFIEELLQKERKIVFFSTSRSDRYAISDIVSLLKSKFSSDLDRRIVTLPILTRQALFFHLSAVDYVIASRLHGVILSHLISKPVLAISFDHKVECHMSSVEQMDYCIDIRRVDVKSLQEKFAQLYRNASSIERTLSAKITDFRRLLASQSDFLITLLG